MVVVANLFFVHNFAQITLTIYINALREIIAILKFSSLDDIDRDGIL